ncbi:MAG: hypothetical protein IPK66_06665 [Rhodospirillales bacterium]|nr:hypothetical protein [Rhodospirillales bacterium]
MIASRLHAASFAITLVGLMAWYGYAAAETAEEPGGSPVTSGAIAIDADKAIEWRRAERIVIARGNAKASRGDTQVQADVLTAHYRNRPDGTTEVWRIDGDGGVRITSPSQTATGERGTYDLDTDTLTLTGGKDLAVTTSTSRITADRQIDYLVASKTLVAHGNAVAVDGERTVYGDVVTIHLADAPKGQSQFQSLDAERNVRFVTAQDDIRADHGTYDADSGIAKVNGSVKVVRGSNVLTGCRGEINVKTGISKLLACDEARDGGTRVQGVILPQSLRKN